MKYFSYGVKNKNEYNNIQDNNIYSWSCYWLVWNEILSI